MTKTPRTVCKFKVSPLFAIFWFCRFVAHLLAFDKNKANYIFIYGNNFCRFMSANDFGDASETLNRARPGCHYKRRFNKPCRQFILRQSRSTSFSLSIPLSVCLAGKLIYCCRAQKECQGFCRSIWQSLSS